MATRKEKTGKRITRKAKPAPKRAAGKASRPARSTARRRKAGPKKIVRKAGPRKAAPRKAARTRRAVGRNAAAPRVGGRPGSSGTSALSPAGEVYGEESWKEEELSAAELNSDGPPLDELEAELEGPEILEETDDTEW